MIICAAVDLSLERGICDSSCLRLRMPGIHRRVALRRLRRGFRFGRLGYELVERKGLRGFEGFVCLIFSSLDHAVGDDTSHVAGP